MTNRVTNADLERVCRLINSALGLTSHEPYLVKGSKEGPPIHNVGCVYLGGAYGGVRIEQMCEGGGCRDLLSTGYDTKRLVYGRACAYLEGLNVGKGLS